MGKTVDLNGGGGLGFFVGCLVFGLYELELAVANNNAGGMVKRGRDVSV